MEKTYDLDWSGVSEDVAKLILKQGELHLEAQLKLVIAADQRAMVTGGALVAVASSIVTATIAISTLAADKTVLVAGLPTAAVLVLAAIVSVRAARPVLIGHAGTPPIQWGDQLVEVDPVVLIGGEAENYQTRIDINDRVLVKNARRLNTALLIALASPFIGTAIWTINRWICPLWS